jgi:hypothetical protein
MHCAPIEDVEIDGTGSNEPVGDPVVICPGAEVDVTEATSVGLLTIIVVVEDGVAELQIASPAAPYNWSNMQCTKYEHTRVLVTTPASSAAAAAPTTAASTAGTAAAAASNAARSASSVIGIPDTAGRAGKAGKVNSGKGRTPAPAPRSPNCPCGASATTSATRTCSSQTAICDAYSAAVAEVCFWSKSLANWEQMSVATLLSEPVAILSTVSPARPRADWICEIQTSSAPIAVQKRLMDNRKRTSFHDGERDIRPTLFVAVEVDPFAMVMFPSPLWVRRYEDPLTETFCVLVTVKFGCVKEKVEMNFDEAEEGHVSPFVQV